MAPNTAGDPIERNPLVHRNADGEPEFPDLLQPVTTPTAPAEPAVKPSDLELPEEQLRAQPWSPGVIGPG